GFDWSILKDGSVLVDVGGGIGHSSLSIAKRYPTLRVVIQDLSHTVDGAKGLHNFSACMLLNAHINDDTNSAEGHNFFTPQPVKKPDVFLLRYIIHNCPDAKTVTILQHLRDAARPTTQLVIVEKILPLASADQASEVDNIPGAARPMAKAPLLAVARAMTQAIVMSIHTMLGGGKRTLDGYIDLLHKSGWKLVQVCHCGRSQLSHLVAKPI
ncbi:S-adenosyl-L-methionine-dependent methyltransferase, partial [Mycena epipterygia]